MGTPHIGMGRDMSIFQIGESPYRYGAHSNLGTDICTEGGIRAGGEVLCSMRFLASIDHDGGRHPTDAMRPRSRLLSIQQSTNILGNRLASLKLEKVIIKYVY
jgi:hypothetical protein